MPQSAYVLVQIITQLELGGAQLATLHQVIHSQFCPGPHHLLYGPGGMLDATIRGRQDMQGWPIPALTGRLRPRRDSQALLQVMRTLKQIRRQNRGRKLLVHTHSSKAGVIGRAAAWAVGADCIVHSIHGFGHQPSMPWPLFAGLWAAERLAASVTTGFTADSQANLDRGRKEGLIARKPNCVVRCGVDLEAFAPGAPRPGLREDLHISAADQIVLSVACLKAQKDPRTWVRVAQRVLHLRPHTTFLLAGDGILRPQIEANLAAAGLGPRCRLLGWRHDVPDLMRLADVILHTSRWEGLPQLFPHAMAIGRPLVATAVDGAPEAIVAGENGLLRAPGDAKGLAADVVTLLDSPALRRAMGLAGQAKAQAFALPQMVAKLDVFYKFLTSQFCN